MSSCLIRKNILKLKPYIPGKPIEEVQRELGIKNIIKLASNENAGGSSPKALSAIKNYLNKIYLYPDGNSYSLKNSLALHLKVKPENIVLGAGSDEIIHLIVLAFLNKNEEVITGHPSFVIYETNTTLMGGRLKKVLLKDFRFDLKGIRDKISDKTKLIFIANPNNPTGTIVKEKEVVEFLNYIPSDVIVVMDEAYYEYVEDKEYPDSLNLLKKYKNLIVLRTFSKIYGLAGLRIGCGIGAEDLIAYLNQVREPFNVSSIAQVAAEAALKDKEHLKKSRKINIAGKRYLYREFKKLGLFYVPTEANFILVKVGVNSRWLFEKMLKLGVIVRTGDIFGYPDFIRVTIGRQKENERFIQALKEVLNKL